jgi:dolichyl-phosphate beta-glucosyltransferase
MEEQSNSKNLKSNNHIYLSVVTPAYNEEKNILNTLKKIEGFLEQEPYNYEVLVMNDGSQDKTGEIAGKYADTNSKIKVYNLPHRGKAPTVVDGIKTARGKYVLFTDADSATPIEEVKKLLFYAVEENYEVVIASREGIGAVRHNEPFTRHIMGRIFNKIVQFLLLPGIEDTQCGFKLFENKAAKKVINNMKLYTEAQEISVPRVTAFDVEMLYVAKKLGYKIKSVSVEWNYGKYSKVSHFRDSLVNLSDVLKVWWNNKKGVYS